MPNKRLVKQYNAIYIKLLNLQDKMQYFILFFYSFLVKYLLKKEIIAHEKDF